jgi:hypothetical protein
MLLGAEMNQVIEWHIPGGKDEGEKVPRRTASPTSTAWHARRPGQRNLLTPPGPPVATA